MTKVPTASKMQTQISGAQFRAVGGETRLTMPETFSGSLNADERIASLKAAYRQLFKENRDLGFHHNANLDSRYLNGQLTTRELVQELLCSDMYINYVMSVNSNYRFISLCFERVLGRQATQGEVYQWSSLLASQGLRAMVEALTTCEEYEQAFGDLTVPHRRSQSLSSSNQGLPALPKEASEKRYRASGGYNEGRYSWPSGQPPQIVRQAGAVFAVAGTLEVARVIAMAAWAAIGTGFGG